MKELKKPSFETYIVLKGTKLASNRQYELMLMEYEKWDGEIDDLRTIDEKLADLGEGKLIKLVWRMANLISYYSKDTPFKVLQDFYKVVK